MEAMLYPRCSQASKISLVHMAYDFSDTRMHPSWYKDVCFISFKYLLW